MNDIGIVAAVFVVAALVSRRLERTPISLPMVFVAAGILAGPQVLDLVGLELTGGSGLIFAELALVLVLFSDAARIDVGSLRGNAALPARMLALGMPLTIALGVIAGALLLTDLEFWEAAIVAAVLAPTDAALGQAVVSSKLMPVRIRQALNVESGLNDGLAIPFLAVFIALAAEDAVPGAEEWILFTVELVGLGALTGVLVGGLGGWLIDRAIGKGWVTGTFQQLAVVALAVVAWALAEAVGGSGFIAAFVGGLTMGRITRVCGDTILNFAEDEGQFLNLSVFFIFGVAALDYLQAASWGVVAFSLLSLTVIRMLPVAISLLGTGLRRSSVAFLAWFGPRGLASIVLALVVVENEPELPGLDIILAAMTVTVLASVVAHGVTARPLVRAYHRHLDDMEPDEAEMVEVPEMRTRGRLSEPVETG